MAHHRLDQTAEAQRWLARAARWLDVKMQEASADAALPWYRRVEYQLLRREAEALLGEVKP